MNPKIGQIARIGGEAKAARRDERVRSHIENLPDLTDFAAAQCWLRVVAELAASGLLPGSQASAAARAVEIWVRTEHARVDRNRVRDLERQVKELERRLAKAAPSTDGQNDGR